VAGLFTGNASTLMYKLKITPDGNLSPILQLNGGSWLAVLANQAITASNGSLPSTIRFGFAGRPAADRTFTSAVFQGSQFGYIKQFRRDNLKQSRRLPAQSGVLCLLRPE